MKNKSLWKSLQQFELDDPEARFDFSARLVAENRWTPEFATQLCEEYKRFLYLCLEAGHPVTPSDCVDQAWHLHMIYTRSYWIDLCRDTLGQDIHHGPTKGGPREQRQYFDWYQHTLASYEREFQAPPPPEFWPPPELRFQNQFRRIDCNKHWVLPKSTALLLGGMTVTTLGLVGCARELNAGELGVLIFLILPGLAFLTICVQLRNSWHFSSPRRKNSKKKRSNRWWNGCGGTGGGGGCSSNSGCGSSCGGGGCGSG